MCVTKLKKLYLWYIDIEFSNHGHDGLSQVEDFSFILNGSYSQLTCLFVSVDDIQKVEQGASKQDVVEKCENDDSYCSRLSG